MASNRRVPSGGTPHSSGVMPYQLYGTLEPGDSAFCLPVFFNRYPDPDALPAEEEYIAWTENVQAVRIYDPFRLVCAFGMDGAGEIILATYSHYANRYITAVSYGLTRLALLSADLTVGGNAAATISCLDPSGGSIGSLNITAYSHQSQGNTLASGSKIIVHYMTSERKWYTGAYYDAT